ncbi:hypothetical protein QTP86_027436, partial [Hemibagrus guttatus]
VSTEMSCNVSPLSSPRLVTMLLTLGLPLVFWTTLIHTQSLELFNFTKEDALTCSQGLTDCNIKPGDICLYHDDRVYVSGLSAQALLCSSHQGLRPCLRIRINITAAGIHEETALSGEDSYNDGRSENRSKEHGSGLEPSVSTSMSVQVCYQGPDVSGSKELTFTLASSDDQTAQMWMSLVVELREDDFGSTVTVFSSNTHKPSFTKDIKIPAIDKVPILYPEINPKTGMAELRVGDLPKDEVHELQACQRMEKDGPCLRLDWIWWMDGPRKTFCPFLNNTVLSVSNVSVSVMESLTYHSGMVRNNTALVWNITAPCRLEAVIHLCKKTSGFKEDCHVTDDLRNSRHHIHSHEHRKWNLINKQHWQLQGEFARVERHPSLCVQIKVKGIEGHFDPVCPFETHRTHWSLFLLVSVLLMCLAILGAYVLQGLLKGWIFKWLKMDSISSRVGDGQVVLLYPPDADSAVAVLVCHLGSALSSLGFGVSLELWSREELTALGPVPWLHSRLHRMQCHGGKVVLVLTPAAWARAEEWCRSRGEKTERRENYSDVFSASLSCILADYLQGRAGERFALVQFETQPAEPPNERGSMPELFRGLPLFSLPSQSLGFLTEITHGAHKGQKENERAESRRTQASVLRAGARILAGTLRELTGGAGYKLAEVSQDCRGLEKDDPWDVMYASSPLFLILVFTFDLSMLTVQAGPCQSCRKLTENFIKGLERTANKNFGGGNTAWEEEKLAKYTRRHFLQLFWRDPEAFPGQPRDIVSPACPGSSPGPLPGGACPEQLPRETSWRHLKQMPEPPQLPPFDVEEQRLYSKLLPELTTVFGDCHRNRHQRPAPDGCVNNGGGEHGPLRLNVPNLPGDLVETLPEVSCHCDLSLTASLLERRYKALVIVIVENVFSIAPQNSVSLFETRLLEIVETACEKNDFECNKLLEQIEDQVETWWFHRQQEAPDLFEWLCIEELRFCCPAGRFGPECAECPSGPGGVCGGLGRCEGEGTRLGDGECVCDPGYSGPLCQDCADGYYREKSSNHSQPPCSACYHACKKCSGPQDYKCLDCKPGWILHDNKCVDVDECGTELARCSSNTYCFNTDGSYECRGCDQACVGCMGSGPARCKKCARGYRLIGAKCLDVDECKEKAIACPGLNEACINEDGSFRCECAEGFIRRDSICVENLPLSDPNKGLFDDMTDDEVLVLQQMFFGVVICALATLAAKGDMVFTAIFIGGVAAMAGYWLSEKGDRMLDGILKGR